VERPEAKVFAKRERYKKRFYHASSPKSVAQVIHAFWKSSGQTPNILGTITLACFGFNKQFQLAK
jgi:hypothetical protein